MSNATVIDEFVVALGLDPSNFNAGQKKTLEDFKKTKDKAKETAKDIEESGKQAAQFYSKIKTEALGLFAVIAGAGGIEKFAAATVTSFSAMGRASKAMGLSVSDLAPFQNMIVRNGGSAEAARASLQGLAQQMEEWKVTGNTANLPWLNRI